MTAATTIVLSLLSNAAIKLQGIACDNLGLSSKSRERISYAECLSISRK